MSVVRIPEVMGRIRQAQKILDDLDLPKMDLLNAICSTDESFSKNAKLKTLAIAIVQTGLYDRYLKTQRAPDYFVGASRGDSAADVAAGLTSFKDLVSNSQAVESLRGSERVLTLVTEKMAQAAAVANESFRVLRPSNPAKDGAREGAKLETAAQMRAGAELEFALRLETPHDDAFLGAVDMRQAVQRLQEESSVTRFIHIGPGGGMKTFDYSQFGNDEIEALDSIELDPMLGWFWRSHRASVSTAPYGTLAN